MQLCSERNNILFAKQTNEQAKKKIVSKREFTSNAAVRRKQNAANEMSNLFSISFSSALSRSSQNNTISFRCVYGKFDIMKPQTNTARTRAKPSVHGMDAHPHAYTPIELHWVSEWVSECMTHPTPTYTSICARGKLIWFHYDYLCTSNVSNVCMKCHLKWLKFCEMENSVANEQYHCAHHQLPHNTYCRTCAELYDSTRLCMVVHVPIVAASQYHRVTSLPSLVMRVCHVPCACSDRHDHRLFECKHRIV